MGGGQSTTERPEEENPEGEASVDADEKDESTDGDTERTPQKKQQSITTPSKPIISPEARKGTRTVRTPKKGAKDDLQMDVAVDNKVVFSQGDEISFMPTDRDEIIKGMTRFVFHFHLPLNDVSSRLGS